MNERIRELALQAVEETHSIMIMEYKNFESKLYEKFAELIVAECIQTIQMGITRDGHNTEQYLRSIKHIKQIKEHFGVEE